VEGFETCCSPLFSMAASDKNVIWHLGYPAWCLSQHVSLYPKNGWVIFFGWIELITILPLF